MGLLGERRAIIDANGSVLKKKDTPYGQLVTKALDPKSVVEARRIARDKSLSVPERIKKGLGVKPYKYSSLDALIPASQQWRVLDKAYFESHTISRRWALHVEHILYARHYQHLFDDYTYSQKEGNGLRMLQENGVKNTLGTGISFHARERLIEMLGNSIDDLDPLLSMVMTPEDKSGVDSKNVLGIVSEEEGEEVLGFEDDLYVGITVARNTGAHVFFPLSRDVALEQRHQFDWTRPEEDDWVWDHLHFNHGLQEMARKIAA